MPPTQPLPESSPPPWCATLFYHLSMPSGPDARRLVTYVPVAHAEEIARRAALDGRTVSGWLARLVADTLGADVAPAAATASDPAPTPPAADPVADAHEHAPASRRARDDPEYAAWLRRRQE